MIHCEKCKTVNPPDQRYCQNCHHDLLPGTSIWVRIVGFLFCLVIAAAAAWVVYRMYMAESLPDLGCVFTSPIWWGLLAIITPITGFVFLVKRTPPHERYFERAKRHVALDRDQALADFNEAVRLAPEKARAPIYKERAKLLDLLGHTKEAIRDKIAVAEDAGAHDSSGDFAQMLGADKDAFVKQMKEQDRKTLLSTGAVVAVGYCPKHREIVVLNEKSRCAQHPNRSITDIHMALPEDVEKIKAEMMEKRRRDNRKKTLSWIFAIVMLVITCLVLRYVFGS